MCKLHVSKDVSCIYQSVTVPHLFSELKCVPQMIKLKVTVLIRPRISCLGTELEHFLFESAHVHCLHLVHRDTASYHIHIRDQKLLEKSYKYGAMNHSTS